METLYYSEDHTHFQKRLRAFLEREIKPYVGKWEKDKIVPKDAWKKMGREGFLCTGV